MNPFIDGTPKYPNKHTENHRDAAEAAFQGSGASADDVEDNRDRRIEKALDAGLKETFPASDPVSITPGAD
jgi:hypothetical protein